MSEESERVIRHRGELLSTLVKQEGYKLLEEEVGRKEKRMQNALWAVLMSDQPPSDLGEQVAFVKGFFRGMNYTINVPRWAAQKLGGVPDDAIEEIEDRWSTWART